MRLCLEYEGKKFFVGDLTLADVEALEAELGVPYSEIKVLGNMRHKRVMLRTLLAREYASDKVDAILAGLTLDQVEKAFTAVDDMPDAWEDGVPLAEGDPSTTTS